MKHTIHTISPAARNLALALSEHKGEWMTAEWESTAKPAAAHKGKTLTKRCTATVRTGVSFANLKVVREAIEAGERPEVASLPWGEWAVFPFVIVHKGTEYVRLTLAGSSHISVQYFVDGVHVERDAFNAFLTPSDAKSGERPEVISVKMENIRRLG